MTCLSIISRFFDVKMAERRKIKHAKNVAILAQHYLLERGASKYSFDRICLQFANLAQNGQQVSMKDTTRQKLKIGKLFLVISEMPNFGVLPHVVPTWVQPHRGPALNLEL